MAQKTTKKSSKKSKVESRKSKVESRKSKVENLDAKIGVVALYLRGLLFHRSDAGHLLMEYIDYMELTEKIEHPNKAAKNWIQIYNVNSLKRRQIKEDIVNYVCNHRYLYHIDDILNTLFGKGEWQKPINS